MGVVADFVLNDHDETVLSYRCIVTTLLRLLWVGLQYVIAVFPDHTHLLFFLSF